MTSTISVEAAGRTHVGLVRRRNEDAMYLGQSLFVVADGLGGHPAGDIASATAIETLQTHDHQVDPADLPTALGRAINAANVARRKKIAAEPELAGMGTTLVAMLRSGTAAALANVGDSRAYLRRGGKISQITEDHTYQHLVADAASVPNLPERLARWLDGRPDGRSPDLTTWELRPSDRYLLCSDGLSSFVPHDRMADALNMSSTPDETADQLIRLAIDHGGPDNITVIIIDAHASGTGPL